jgi:hypothetical protein
MNAGGDAVVAIIDPVGHRIAEHHDAEMAEMAITDGTPFIFVTPASADEWYCDICNATIDITEPVVAVDAHALCNSCAQPTLRTMSVNGRATLNICPCRPCQRAAAL